MNSLCFVITAVVIAPFLLLLITSVTCSSDPPKMMTGRDELLYGQKTRLGSMPPSCHNKCNQCHPCKAVQVPTLPSHDRVQAKKFHPTGFLDLSYGGYSNRYANYKPLGWRCRCNGHFYSP
ncbi:hypothetical protein Nepgr_007781 [Nepenthes gracilis]|uniref:Epidermal patterning factor-like protein n=1 Tax=Nepenthes gracilis TaxID=150966 RepID=A0AAD3XIU6_NEPGR|nr:hypothetical protein Nepgr_007781 [Nepenthes gracilis]